MHINRILLGLMFGCLLSSCAHQIHHLSHLNEFILNEAMYLNMQKNVNTDTFKLSGKMSIKQDKKGYFVSFDLKKEMDNLEIIIYSPLKQIVAKIIETPDYAEIESSGKIIKADNSELLTEQLLGFYLPVSHLKYWLNGIESPELETLNKVIKHDRISFEQNDWHIEFQNYQKTNIGVAPKLIIFKKEALIIRFLIHAQ